MKKLLIVLVFGLSLTVFAQFKNSDSEKPDISQGMFKTDNSLFGFLNSPNFNMKQSYSMSYSTFGGQGMALGVYTNNMSYQFSKNLDVELEASVVNSPYSTFGKSFQNSINGIYLNRAAVNYKPWKDVSISFEYSRLPYYYSPYSSLGGFGNNWNNNFFTGR